MRALVFSIVAPMAVAGCKSSFVNQALDAGPPPPVAQVVDDAAPSVDSGAPAEAGTDAGVDIDAGREWDPDGAPIGDGIGGLDAGRACSSDMVAVETFCVDRYEAPNQEGALPLTMQTANDGEAWCASRGKRLCTEAEWVATCRGDEDRPYPYGFSYVRGRCNDDKAWRVPNWSVLATWPSDAAKTEAARLYQADPSGSRAGCESQDGVNDLTGNVAEWVTRSFPNANNYDHVLKGCYWAGCYGGSPPSCAFVNPAHPGGFRTYEAGFRCCRSR